MGACSIEATYVAVDAGVVGRYRDQYLLGRGTQNARQPTCYCVDFARVSELGQQPGETWGVGGAYRTDLGHEWNTSYVIGDFIGRLI